MLQNTCGSINDFFHMFSFSTSKKELLYRPQSQGVSFIDDCVVSVVKSSSYVTIGEKKKKKSAFSNILTLGVHFL